jgi:16S rRNA processing protein RimM
MTALSPYLRVGLILLPHGVSGAIKLQPLTADVRRFAALKEAYLEDRGVYTPIMIQADSIQPEAVTLHIEGLTTREAAEALRGRYLCVDRAHALKLPPGQYFVADLIGCKVFDSDGKAYGQLKEVLETGANDVYVIEGAGRLLIPALKKLLQEVDILGRKITLDAAVLREVGLFED